MADFSRDTNACPRFADLTTMGVGGRIARFVEPRTEDEFIAAVQDADACNLPLCVIGGGSNMLVSDDDFDGVVVRDARCDPQRYIEFDLEDERDASGEQHTNGEVRANAELYVSESAGLIERGEHAGEEALTGSDIRPGRLIPSSDAYGYVTVAAGVNWDDFVAWCAERDRSQIEALSGIPGTVGASVVQNIGAYGQEVASFVNSVTVFDRQTGQKRTLNHTDLKFGYRMSLLKQSMYCDDGTDTSGGTDTSVGVVAGVAADADAPTGVPDTDGISSERRANRFFPSPRYIVLDVTFGLPKSRTSMVGEVSAVDGVAGNGAGERQSASGQLYRALLAEGLEISNSNLEVPNALVRQAVLAIRARKGMLEDPYRYESPWMRGTKDEANVAEAQRMFDKTVQDKAHGLSEAESASIAAELRANRHSCGSFFTNPVLSKEQAKLLPEDAPKYRVATGEYGEDEHRIYRVKTSAAWLIDHAGFHKGFALPSDSEGVGDIHEGGDEGASRSAVGGVNDGAASGKGHAAGASLSTVHTLALTNRGGASAQQIAELAREIVRGVREKYGVQLVPEPVVIGLDL